MLNALNEFLFEGDVREKTIVKYSSIPLSVIVIYALFVKWIGPAIMKNRKPFDLKYAMITYDFMQCYVNAYLTYTIFVLLRDTWDFRCMVKHGPQLEIFLQRVLRVGWHVYLIKFADLIDTCFFVLRKKHHQISFLHVFHHTVVCLIASWCIKYMKDVGFYMGFGLTINTSVHVVMYFYYALAAMGKDMQQNLWWKIYITLFQMAQFLTVLAYMAHGFIIGCEELGMMEICVFLFVVIILVLFVDYYKKYFQSKQSKEV